MADSTAMTVDFLRARLLSERSVSRAAKERADELAKRVAELEEQVRAVTAQRRQAERAAAEVLAILESQGFGGHLSDVADESDDSGQDNGEEDGGKRRGDTAGATGEEGEKEEASAHKGEAEDALSGTAQPGGLSWKGRSVSPRKARQLKQRHRRSYSYLLSSSSDSSPKYRMGQSCRKNKRRVELSNGSRSVATEDGGGSQKGRQDGSDFTDDGQVDMDGEVGADERISGAGGGGGQYVIRYEEDGEMERVLERQAELIGQYEEEEKAQREWEKQYNENRNANKGDVELKNKTYQTETKAKSNVKTLARTNNPSAQRLQKGSISESPQNGAQRREANEEPDHGRVQTSSISAPESSTNSTVTRQDQDRGDQISDGDSGYSTNARSPKHDAVIRAPSDGSPSSDTLNSKVSDWSSSQFHDCTDSQLDTQSSYPPASLNIADIESVLQALQRARISLSTSLSKPVPPSEVTLALPAPGDEHREYDDLPANNDDDEDDSYGEKLSGSSPALQEMLTLPAPEDYHDHERDREDLLLDDAAISHIERASSSSPREEMLALTAPGDDYRKEIEEYMKIPVGIPGLFRLPIKASFGFVGSARFQTRSTWIAAARFEVRCGLKSVFGSAWLGTKSDPARIPACAIRPGTEPDLSPSGTKSLGERASARGRVSGRRRRRRGSTGKATPATATTTATVNASPPRSTLLAAFSPAFGKQKIEPVVKDETTEVVAKPATAAVEFSLIIVYSSGWVLIVLGK